MKCGICSASTRTLETRALKIDSVIRRTRYCARCDVRFYTHERQVSDPLVSRQKKEEQILQLLREKKPREYIADACKTSKYTIYRIAAKHGLRLLRKPREIKREKAVAPSPTFWQV